MYCLLKRKHVFFSASPYFSYCKPDLWPLAALIPHPCPFISPSLLVSTPAFVSNLLSSSRCKEERIQTCRHKAPRKADPPFQLLILPLLPCRKKKKRPPPH